MQRKNNSPTEEKRSESIAIPEDLFLNHSQETLSKFYNELEMADNKISNALIRCNKYARKQKQSMIVLSVFLSILALIMLYSDQSRIPKYIESFILLNLFACNILRLNENLKRNYPWLSTNEDRFIRKTIKDIIGDKQTENGQDIYSLFTIIGELKSHIIRQLYSQNHGFFEVTPAPPVLIEEMDLSDSNVLSKKA